MYLLHFYTCCTDTQKEGRYTVANNWYPIQLLAHLIATAVEIWFQLLMNGKCSAIQLIPSETANMVPSEKSTPLSTITSNNHRYTNKHAKHSSISKLS